jgi:hypothetical protein
VSAVLAWMLLEMIALCTNLFYFQKWSFVDRGSLAGGKALVVDPDAGAGGADCWHHRAVSLSACSWAWYAGGG